MNTTENEKSTLSEDKKFLLPNMGKCLIITEKPSVAREYAQILHVNEKHKGYLENDQYIITWCIGHLVGLSYPEKYDPELKKWELDALPFLPEKYLYEVNSAVAEQFRIVSKQLTRTDCSVILWAGDSGREGQVIEENIRKLVPIPDRIVEKRVWIDSTTEEEIKRGMREAKPMSDYKNLADAGDMRAIEDYATGINFSRALSVRYGNILNRAAGGSYKAIAVGRVMSCVLGMIVSREREIRNFVETLFYKPAVKAGGDLHIVADWKAKEESPKLYKDIGFLDKRNAQDFLTELQGKPAIIKNVTSKKEKKSAPLLFNLAELQGTCTKLFHMSPDQTLNVAQSLYEKKLTTYPRTDARVLTTAISEVVANNIRGLTNIKDLSPFALEVLDSGNYQNISRTKYVDDSKVTDHYAIIPTGETQNYSSLSEIERTIYELICKRFLSIFFPPAEYGKVQIVLDIGGESFYSNTKVLAKTGYLSVSGTENGVNELAYARKLATLQKGQQVSIEELYLKDGKTQPPKRYTSGSMVLAMENAGQLIEEEELREQIKGAGIGTSATRAEIIKKLNENKHIHTNAKTQVLTPTNFGEMIYEVLALTIPAMLNPKMTASWEKGLEQIAEGKISQNVYRNKFENFVQATIHTLKENDLSMEIKNAITPFANESVEEVEELSMLCPKCMKNTIRLFPEKGYGCSGFKKGDEHSCTFFVGKICGKLLSKTQFMELIENGVTKEPVTGLKTKEGKKFSTRLVLNKDCKVEFYDDEEFIKDSSVPCPKCTSMMNRYTKSLRCPNCAFNIKHSLFKRVLSDTEIKILLKNHRLQNINDLISKKGTKFTADIILTEDYKLVLDFNNGVEEKESIFACPKCKKTLKEKGWYYVCQCGFSIPHSFSHYRFDAENMQKLLNGEATNVIDKFQGKNGNYSASVKYNRRSKKFQFC